MVWYQGNTSGNQATTMVMVSRKHLWWEELWYQGNTSGNQATAMVMRAELWYQGNTSGNQATAMVMRAELWYQGKSNVDKKASIRKQLWKSRLSCSNKGAMVSS